MVFHTPHTIRVYAHGATFGRLINFVRPLFTPVYRFPDEFTNTIRGQKAGIEETFICYLLVFIHSGRGVWWRSVR